MSYQFFTDSSADLTPALVAETGIHVIPLSVKIDNHSYRNWVDEREIKHKDFYAMLRDEKTAVTSQVNVYEFIEAFRPFLEKGEDIFYLSFSAALSGTYHSFLLAQQELKTLYPKRIVLGVDSLGASLGQGLLAYLAVQQKQAGLTIKDLETWVINQRLRIVHLFTVDDLNHLKRGGRLSGSAALIGTMIRLKPLLHVDDEGHLVAFGKVLGRKNALNHLVERMAERIDTSEEQTVFLSHGDCLAEATYVANLIQARYPVKTIKIGMVGPVIGAHSGPGTIAIFFVGSPR